MNEEIALGKLLKGRKVTGEKTLGILPYKIKCKRETELKKHNPTWKKNKK